MTLRAQAKSPAHADQLYDLLSTLLIVGLVVLAAVTFRDYGISNDEPVQKRYGELLLDFYRSGLTDQSAFSYVNLYLYGGLFDMAAALLTPWLPFNAYDTRHLLSAAVGILGIIGTGRLARLLAGPRAGFLATLLLSVSGVYYGAMFNNTKDVPFACGMTWMLYYACRLLADLPRPSWRPVLAFGVVTGLTLGVRVGAVFGLFYLGCAVVAFLIVDWRRRGWRKARSAAGRIAVRMLPALLIAYALMALLWPWAVFAPLNPVRAISGLTEFNIETLRGGVRFSSLDLPVDYLATYLLIKIPDVTLAGLVLAPIVAGDRLWRRQARAIAPSTALPWGLVAWALVFPLAYFVLARPAIYNGLRHFLFLVPVVTVIAAGGWHGLAVWVGRVRPFFATATLGLFLAGALGSAATLVRLHPHQYVYYNSLVGGLPGAAGRYELDYWSNFTREAVSILTDHVRKESGGRPLSIGQFKVGLCTEDPAFDQFAPDIFATTENGEETDFFIATTQANCDQALDGRVIAEIKRDGVVLGVIKDRREQKAPRADGAS